MAFLWSLLPCFHACLPVSSGGSGGFSRLIGIADVRRLSLYRCGCEQGMDPRTFVLVMTDAEYCVGSYGKYLIVYCERQYWKNAFVSRRERERQEEKEKE
jgi:hypothetical protein